MKHAINIDYVLARLQITCAFVLRPHIPSDVLADW